MIYIYIDIYIPNKKERKMATIRNFHMKPILMSGCIFGSKIAETSVAMEGASPSPRRGSDL